MEIQHSSTPESVQELLREQLRQRSHVWGYVVVPTLLLGFPLVLWLLTALFGGTLSAQRPLPILATGLILGLISIAGRTGYRYLQNRLVAGNQLMQATPGALARISEAAKTSTSRREIARTLEETLDDIFKPKTIEITLYRPASNDYAVYESDLVLAANAPFVEWLLQQPANAPLSLVNAPVPEDARPSRSRMIERGLTIIIPLGKQGWIALGAPKDENQEYTPAHLTLLGSLAYPVSIGMERGAMLENQRKRAKELDALYWIAQAVNFTVPLDDILELVYTQLKRVSELPNFYIALTKQEGDRLAFSFFIENGERSYPDKEWNSSEGLTGLILQNSMTIRTDNYLEECHRRSIHPSGTPGLAWMGTPLNAGNTSVGVMVASSYDPNITFSEEDESFFVTVAAYIASILERRALYERLESRAKQLGTLNEIGNLLASSLDLNEVLDLVVRNAAELLESEAGSLLLLDEDSGDLVFRVSSGPTAEKLIGMKVPAGKGIAGAAFSENRPVIVEDTQHDQRWYGSFDKKSEFITRAIIAVPLNARGRTIGVLEVINPRDGRNFNQEDTDLLLAFGAQAAIAIENAHLFTMTDQALQERLEELTTLQHIDRQLNATLDYREVMGQTLEWAVRITGTTNGLIAALQEEEDGTQGLRFLAHQGYPEELFERYAEKELWPLKKGLMGRTVQTGEMSLVNDITIDPYYTALVPDMQAQLTVPIKREDRVIGVIALESVKSDSFSPENVALIVRLADHAAIAIDNARLFQEVQRANEAKTEFVSFVSHELKQPMTAIKGYTDLLTKGIGGELNEQQKQFISVIYSNIQRMDRLVQDLLDVSRIESGRLKLEMGPVVPEEIVSEAVHAFEQSIATKDQEFHVEMEPELPVVEGDRGRLIQVLTNLVSNANKYTPEGGQISIRVNQLINDGHAYVRWSVEDSGIGMTQEELERLFTKYFRSDNPAVRSVKGTGLGLVITRSIVELHGGEIWVESEYQKGSTFSFAIPVKLS